MFQSATPTEFDILKRSGLSYTGAPQVFYDIVDKAKLPGTIPGPGMENSATVTLVRGHHEVFITLRMRGQMVVRNDTAGVSVTDRTTLRRYTPEVLVSWSSAQREVVDALAAVSLYRDAVELAARILTELLHTTWVGED